MGTCVFAYSDGETRMTACGPMPPFAAHEGSDGGLEIVISTYNLTVEVDELAVRADAFGLWLRTDADAAGRALVAYSALTPPSAMASAKGSTPPPSECRLDVTVGPRHDLSSVEFIQSACRLRIVLPKKSQVIKPLRLQVQRISGD